MHAMFSRPHGEAVQSALDYLRVAPNPERLGSPGRPVQLCRLPITNPANFLEARFWIASCLPTRTKPLVRRTLRVG
jgi:hypothetical protein